MSAALELNSTLLQQLEHLCPRHFVLSWEGTEIPRGAKIGKTSIQWAQHGLLTGPRGEILGFYRRTREFSGKSLDEHEMIVSSDHQVFTPDGTLCPAFLEPEP